MEPLRRTSALSEQVMLAVREAITSGRWAAGEVHSVAEVASLLEVSRTPVREAIIKLADTGLIGLERNVGFRVLGNTPKALAEIFHMRLLLEGAAVRRTARRADPDLILELERAVEAMRTAARDDDEPAFTRHDVEFHDLAIRGAGSDRLVAAVRQLRDATLGLGSPQLEYRRTLADIVAEFEPILDAIRRRDPDGAEDALVHHLRETATALLTRVPGAEDPDAADAMQLIDPESD